MKKRNSCDGCGIRLETDAKYCKYCGAERKEVPDDFVEEDGIQASTTKKIRYCKYCGRRFEKNIKQCSCEEKPAENIVVEEKMKIAATTIVEPENLLCELEEEDTKYDEPEYQKPESEEWKYEEPESEGLKLKDAEETEWRYEEPENQKLNCEEPVYEEESLQQKKPIGKAVKIAAAVLMLGGAGAAGVFLSNNSGNELSQNTMTQKNQSAIKEEDPIEILQNEAAEERAESEAERVRQESELAREESERAESEAERARQESELAREESERAESEAERVRQESERAKLESERAALEAEIERMEAELEAKKLEQEVAETILYGYEGSYVYEMPLASSYTNSVLLLEDNTYREIANHAILYVDEAWEKNGEKLGHTVYGGLEGWIDLSDYTRISYEDYSISEFSFCFADGFQDNGIDFYSEADEDSNWIGWIPYGTELIIQKQQNGMGYTYYMGQSGWVLIDEVLSYYSDLAYQVVSEEDWISLMMQPSDSSEQVEEAYDGQTLLVDDWQQGWVKTAAWGKTGWVCMAKLQPAGDRNFVDFSVLEKPEDEVTVYGNTTFWEDGTPVSEYDYILPDSANRYLTEEDLEGLTLKGICYAKNEIYARYGRIFKSQELRDYFEGQGWYDGIYEPNESNDALIVSVMNNYEYYNKDLLWQIEQQRGIYKLDQ